MRNPVVNQQLIAEQLNLSRTTVSRCFTNHPGISPDTRSRVFKLAASLGYTYQEGKTGKKSERKALSHYGALICTAPDDYADTDFENPAAKLLSGVSEFAQLQQAKLDVNFVLPGEQSLQSASYRTIEALHNREWDGVLLLYPFPEPIIKNLHKLFPVVSLIEQFTETSLNSVDVNHHRGIELVIQHLLEKGHERIGFITHAYDVLAKWSLRRYSAFIAETARLGISVDEKDIIAPFLAEQLTADQINDRALKQTREGVTA
ncbi:MAG: LacI family DNA-binding transcriptional regulator, partial [Verrucomicrobiota bacterium]